MELRNSWLRLVCACGLALGVGLMPLTASAQDKPKVSAKKHKAHRAAKAVTHRVRHARKSVTRVVHEQQPIPVPPTIEIARAPVVPAGPQAGTPYDEATWRGFHADWNGQYHFNDGKYYYDDEHKYPAQIPNDFNSIVGRFGGIATLDNDPTLVFSGDSGEAYPITQYNADRVMSDKKLKLKCAFFGRAYFWRDGARYDRKIIVDDKGVRCFQFVKHP